MVIPRVINLLLIPMTVCSMYADEIRISASDLLGDFISVPLQVYAKENDVSIKLESIGSLPAMENLRSDDIDLAIIAVPEVDSKLRAEFILYPFAYDIAVVAVNASNPIDEISINRLGGIYGNNEELSLNTWGDLGLSGWGSRSIKPLAGPADDSISLELFKHAVFQGSAMKSSVALVKFSEVEDLVVGDPASIAIMSDLPKSDQVKAIMISESAEGPAFGPSEDNVHYGDYPIRLAFYIVLNERDEAKLKPILRVLLSDDLAKSLRENKLLAVPDTIRRKLTIDLDLED